MRRPIEALLDMLVVELEAIAIVRVQLEQAMLDEDWTRQMDCGMRLASLHDCIGASISEYTTAINSIKTRANNTTRISVGIEQRKLKKKVS